MGVNIASGADSLALLAGTAPADVKQSKGANSSSKHAACKMELMVLSSDQSLLYPPSFEEERPAEEERLTTMEEMPPFPPWLLLRPAGLRQIAFPAPFGIIGPLSGWWAPFWIKTPEV